MTVPMSQLESLHRDLKVAQSVGEMIELRRFEVEFEMYSTVFWEDGKRVYLSSKNESVMYKELYDLALRGCYPLPLQVHTDHKLVPAGWDEEIEQQVKVEACRELKAKFPEDFWIKTIEVAEGHYNDAGVDVLEPLQDDLEGRFDEGRLQLFQSLCELLFLRRNLTPRAYADFCRWLAAERNEMVDATTRNDFLSKIMYGVAYRQENGASGFFVDAVQDNVVRKKLEFEKQAGALASPLYHRKCWYNHNYRISDVRRDFKDELAELFDDDFFDVLQQIDALPVAVDVDAFNKVLAYWQEQGLEDCVAAWIARGRAWGIK